MGCGNREDDLLVSDAERERALATLRQAGIDGRLTLEERSTRVDGALATRNATRS